MSEFHTPVLLKEVLKYLNIKKGEKYIDTTVGGGGHAEAILKKGGKVLGIDYDPEAIKAARRHLFQTCPIPHRHGAGPDASWCLAQGNFAHLKKIAQKAGFNQVAGVLFDLGVSTYQLETPERGFAFSLEGPLDMRMDPSLSVTAADLVNGLNKGELYELFSKLGQEKHSRRIANAIISARRVRSIKTCEELARIIVGAQPKRGGFEPRQRWRHPATRVFQALRIAVNDELNNLKKALPQAIEILKIEGRLVVISFHSGEDRIVKQFFRDAKKRETLEILTEKPVRPMPEEIKRNPSSRSAKLRAVEKRR